MSNIVEITEGAEEYLGNLLKDSEEKNTNIRIFVSDPGSNRAETCIVYCKPGEQDHSSRSEQWSGLSPRDRWEIVPELLLQPLPRLCCASAPEKGCSGCD